MQSINLLLNFKHLIMSSIHYFERIAEDWDLMRESLFSTTLREKNYALAEIFNHSTIADIGAGSGFITEGLVNKEVNIIAVDQSPQMLNIMRKKFSNYKNVEFRLGESEKIPIDESTIDFAFANMYLHHVEDPQKSINELYRILKPGGKLIISDADSHSYDFLVTEQHDRWMGFKREDIRTWYANAGFKNINIVCSGDNCRPKSLSSNQLVEISIFIALGQKV
jgi:ubiquinone/menaquinone biosynthesis C-methylase UbiE